METNNLITLESIGAKIAVNDKIIDEKVTNALAALSAVKVITTPAEDEYANNVLVKCNKTLPIVEDLRKEYTSILDDFKKSKMERENKLKDEMSRVKKERDAYKSREAAEANKKRAEIERIQRHDLHLAEIKNELVATVELGIGERVAKGEVAISNLFDRAVLENVDQLDSRLSFDPTLDESFLRALIDDFDKPREGRLMVKIDHTVVSKEEIEALKERAHKKFNHAFMSEKYAVLVRDIQKKWKAKIPDRKKQLEALSKANAQEAERIKAQAAETKKRNDEEIARNAQEQKAAIEKKANEANTEAITKTTFDAQVQTQSIAEQDGTRKKVVFRFTNDDELLNKPLDFVNIMSSVIAHVVTDKEFLGHFKRDRTTKFVKKDPDTGEVLYLDEVQGWLDVLASIKPTPNISGLTATERVSSIAKAKKDK